MKILMVSSFLPYPLYSGGHIRLFNLIRYLSDKHSIYLICEKRDHQTDKDIQEVKKYCKDIITVPRQKQWTLKNILKTGLSLNSFLITGHQNNIMKNEITQLLSNEIFDLIHAETFYISQNIPNVDIPLIVAEHNIEYLVYKRFADNSPLFIRPMLCLDIQKLKRQEEVAWKRASAVITVSEEEKKQIRKDKVFVIPNGVDLSTFTFNKKTDNIKEKEILFIGDFKWVQNRDAVSWIIKDIWPYLLRAIDGDIKIKLRIVGKNIPDNLKKLDSYDSIYFDENAPEKTNEIFETADILLAPLRIAGGTSYKILEAMASGVPVVTTSRGIAGLEAQAGKHLLVADDVRQIVEKTLGLLRDDDLYKKIVLEARSLIEKEYSWEIIGRKLEKVYESSV